MISDFLGAFIFIFIAEMGDKTQILAMAFATKYPFKKVLFGIFLGSLFNHGIAVILGSFASNVIPLNYIQVIAGFAFILFAFWTLKDYDEGDNEEESIGKFGPIVTVALAFFIGELGDKTQLVAITLATESSYPFVVLGGTVLGMTFTGVLGIIAGKTLGAKIPALAIKIVAGSVFMFFGLVKLYQNVSPNYLTLENVAIFVLVIVVSVLVLVRRLLLQRKNGRELAISRMSRRLFNYYNTIDESLENVCLGVDVCKKCQGDKCVLGCTKGIIKKELAGKKFVPKNATLVKDYDKGNVLESLVLTLEVLKDDPLSHDYEAVQEIRRKLEMILFKKCILNMESWQSYMEDLVKLDRQLAQQIFSRVSKSKN